MEKRRHNYFIYFVAISINTICFATGTAYSWTSPLLPKFQDTDPNINPIVRPLTISECGLLVSIVNLGLLCGPFVSGAIVGKMGKKFTLLITGLPLLIAHIMCAVATSFEVLIVARYLMGLGTGGSWALIPGYLSEISMPKNRGVLSSLMLAFSSFGSLFSYLIGPFISITWFSVINTVPIVIFLSFVFIFVPESPYDLVMKHNFSSAQESLIKLRQTTDVQKELLEIERVIEANSRSHVKLSDIFRNKGSSKALMICTTLMVFNAFSGTLIVLGYTQTIFDVAESSIPSAYSAIIVGSIAVLATMINTQLVDRLGRKPILVLSAVLGALSQGSLSIFFYLQNSGFNINSIKWLPIGCIMTFMFAYNFGMGSLPWVILGELIASNIKAVASVFVTGINFSLCFIITLVYPYLVESIGIASTFLIFSVALALCTIFCILKLPETKGKSFEEIYALLEGKH